jgi:hypothetical protein
MTAAALVRGRGGTQGKLDAAGSRGGREEE